MAAARSLYTRLLGGKAAASAESGQSAAATTTSSIMTDEESEELPRLQRPYPGMLPVPLGPDGRPTPAPPYPPEEPESPVYNHPIVDLRRETFFYTPATPEEQFQPSAPGAPPEIWGGDELHIVKVLEGPVPLASHHRGRTVRRYRVLSRSGKELLLYIDRRKLRPHDPLGTEIEDPGPLGPLKPWIPTTTPPAQTVLGTVAGFAQGEELAREQKRLEQKERPIPKLRFDAVGAERRYTITPQRLSADTRDDQLLHPNAFTSACFPACSWCDDAAAAGVTPRVATGSCGTCCRSSLRCIPAVTMRELFCCGNPMEAGAGPRGITAFTPPHKVLAVHTYPKRVKHI